MHFLQNINLSIPKGKNKKLNIKSLPISYDYCLLSFVEKHLHKNSFVPLHHCHLIQYMPLLRQDDTIYTTVLKTVVPCSPKNIYPTRTLLDPFF